MGQTIYLAICESWFFLGDYHDEREEACKIFGVFRNLEDAKQVLLLDRDKNIDPKSFQ